MTDHNSKNEEVQFCLNSLKEELYGKEKNNVEFIKMHFGAFSDQLLSGNINDFMKGSDSDSLTILF